MLRTSPDLVVFPNQGPVTLTCVVYGYATFLRIPTWIGFDGRSLNTPRYNITTGESSSDTLIYLNGSPSVGPAIVIDLTIKSLTVGDSGTYTCGDGFKNSNTRLTVAIPTTVATTDVTIRNVGLSEYPFNVI
jgi:hypothetical protein